MTCSLMGHNAEININANLVHTIELLYNNAISAVQMNGSTGNGLEQQLESGRYVFLHPPSSIFFLKGLCLMLWKNMMEWLA